MAIFNAMKSGLQKAAYGLDSLGSRLAATGKAGAFADTYGALPAAKALSWMSRRGTIGLSTMGGSAIGGIGGGMYGAFSDDTSVLGGAIKGAGLGAGLGALGGVGRIGYTHYAGSRAAGLGAGQSAWTSVKTLANDAKSFIGKSFSSNKTHGKMNGLK
jgi:hypothetical protein